MVVVQSALTFFGLAVLLAISAHWVVRAVSYFSHTLGIKSFLLGFVLLGFATTIPEMFVAYQSVVDSVPQLSVGNLLGGSILLLSFVMGVGAVFLKRVVLNHGMSIRDIALSTVVVSAPAIVLWDGDCTKREGLFLLSLYVFHLMVINRETRFVAVASHHARHVKHMGHAVFLGVVGTAGIAVSARFIVDLGEIVARTIGVPAFVIGLFLITLGTNLPELALACDAILRKKRDIAFGDILGSAVINTPLLGALGFFSPFTLVNMEKTRITLLLLGVVSVFFFWAAATKKDISRKEGAILLVLYAAFVFLEMLRV